jgi:GTP-binding protein Era
MFKVGYVTILGKPNAGKSTLINTLIGEKVSIVSWKPQTTRDNINGILTGDDYQIVFIDTPGLHNAKNPLSMYMMKSADQAINDSDIVLYIANGSKPIKDEEIESIKEIVNKHKVILALNKLDEADPELFANNFKKLTEIKDVITIIPISALKNKNIDVLKDEILKILPEGEPIFDSELYTDKSVKYMVSEIIREKALKNLDEEVPYGLSVVITNYKTREDDSNITDIDAEIYCEKKAHKAIIIGNNGSMIKKISSEARVDIEKLIGNKVFLTTWVKVKEDWRDNEFLVNEFGYNKKNLT